MIAIVHHVSPPPSGPGTRKIAFIVRLIDWIRKATAHFFAERDQRLIEVLSEKEKSEFNRLLTKISEASADWS